MKFWLVVGTISFIGQLLALKHNDEAVTMMASMFLGASIMRLICLYDERK